MQCWRWTQVERACRRWNGDVPRTYRQHRALAGQTRGSAPIRTFVAAVVADVPCVQDVVDPLEDPQKVLRAGVVTIVRIGGRL